MLDRFASEQMIGLTSERVIDMPRNIQKTLDERRKAAIERMDAYQEIVNAIDMICANKTQRPSGLPSPN
jgi:hypothetical protein